jgi:putative N6-adenine-specific DNA methylase
MKTEYKCFASCSFGLESVTARELKELKLSGIDARDARVYFLADAAGIARANIWLRTADRVYIELTSFTAQTFDELFEGVRAIDWSRHIPKNAAFIVNADSVGSRLFSVSDIQSIAKKAAAVSLMAGHHVSILSETGERYDIHIKLLRDKVSVCLNTSGPGLNRRGYRVANVAAPIRETLAAGLVLLSGWRGGELADPMCGSGTIAIEAAMIGSGTAPGIKRSFDAEKWDGFIKPWQDERGAAVPKQSAEPPIIFASDIDPKAISAADRNARAAGVDIRLFKADVRDFSHTECLVLANPPYAERLGEKNAVHQLYADMGRALARTDKKSIITADDDFERFFGRRATKKRKLYNGSIRCHFYQYF